MSHPELERVLLTGASGYVGGRLLVELQRRGMAIRCLARRPEFLLPKVAPETEVMAGDVLDRDSLAPAMRGIETAYYLVHSMAANDFEETDRLAARNFAAAQLTGNIESRIFDEKFPKTVLYVGDVETVGKQIIWNQVF